MVIASTGLDDARNSRCTDNRVGVVEIRSGSEFAVSASAFFVSHVIIIANTRTGIVHVDASRVGNRARAIVRVTGIDSDTLAVNWSTSTVGSIIRVFFIVILAQAGRSARFFGTV